MPRKASKRNGPPAKRQKLMESKSDSMEFEEFDASSSSQQNGMQQERNQMGYSRGMNQDSRNRIEEMEETGNTSTSTDSPILITIPYEKVEEGERRGHCLLSVGEIVNNRYHLLDKLGYGVYSIVWLAWDNIEKKYVALKVVRNRDEMTFSLRELKVMSKIRQQDETHPGRENCMELLDEFQVETDTGVHLVLVVKMYGPDLYTLNGQIQIEGERMPLEQVRKLCMQILNALHFLHIQCKINHCDLKPENLLLEVKPSDMKLRVAQSEAVKRIKEEKQTGRKALQQESIAPLQIDISAKSELKIVVGDFGLSGSANEKLDRGIQSCNCRAPEVFLKSSWGSPVDLWSFGCIAFELATNNALFPCSYRPEECSTLQHLRKLSLCLGDLDPSFYDENNTKKEFLEYMDQFKNDASNKKTIKQLLIENDFSEDAAEEFSGFLGLCLDYNPRTRITAEQALQHPFIARSKEGPAYDFVEKPANDIVEEPEDESDDFNYPTPPAYSPTYSPSY